MNHAIFILLACFTCGIQARFLLSEQTDNPCRFDLDCLDGHCRLFNETAGLCQCDNNYISRDGGSCNYHQVSKLVAFLLSFFVGGFGVDWFVLARHHAGYIVAGVFKILSLGGLGVWWLVCCLSSIRPLLNVLCRKQ